MAKRRIVNTRFWDDTYISNLDPIEKLMFLYLLTNPATNISGAYEIPLKRIAVDTGIDKEMVEKILRRFKRDSKATYVDGYVVLHNFIKHQELNPKVVKGLEREVSELPNKIREIVYGYSMDSLSHLNLNLNLNLNLTGKVAKATSSKRETTYNHLGAEVVKAFEMVTPTAKRWYGNKTQRSACDDLIDSYGLEQVLKVVSILPQTNKMPYVPTVTTPCQLRDKWAGLESALVKQKATAKGKQVKVAFA